MDVRASCSLPCPMFRGVSSAEVTLDPGQAAIQYDEQKVTPVALQHVVEDVGFDVIA